ncbi:beta-galactosidase GalB [Neptunicella sp. SCSIO 80796]|uniref:beta-galactosidase GalB n=1 Tax=Neptunicella plasticusilytica TaxID=3117012 RepID=UPI003A4DBDB1
MIKKCPYNLAACLALLLSLSACNDKTEPLATTPAAQQTPDSESPRQPTLLDQNWRFMKYATTDDADDLIYDVRPEVDSFKDDKDADSKPTEAVEINTSSEVLKPWILPMANDFIRDPAKHHTRPPGSPGSDFPFVQDDFDDSQWQQVDIPHDWAIAGPFMGGDDAEVGGGMGRLPSHGVAWYRKKLTFSQDDLDKQLYLDIDAAMSYAMVWFNGHLVGGWPYGYNSWRVDLTPYAQAGDNNQLAIRVDNPPKSSRWYPGGGLYRNVWLTKTNPVHVANWGTYITTPQVSHQQAKVELEIRLKNSADTDTKIETQTDIFEINTHDDITSDVIASINTPAQTLAANSKARVNGSVTINNPKLWGPKPAQTPHRYVAVTKIKQGDKTLDQYQTHFGIRDIRLDPEKGVFVNGEHVYLQGVNQHHDLGALGAAFNVRAAQRQLGMLQELGSNAIRIAHNPPAVELLELTDKMGFLVIDEIYDSWERKKTPLDFHLIFPEWHEADLRAFIRRDRNYPSVMMWSVGNEVGEQYTGEEGAAIARELFNISKDEDPTRPVAASMNYAKPDMALPPVMDSISLNYQGEGIRNAPAYAHLQGIKTAPLYPAFHEKFPDKTIFSSENAAALSTRGEYLFPVTDGISAPVADGKGGDPLNAHVSAYELYTAPFGSSADKVLASLAKHPYVAGGFVWSGWDYLGEPTPYYSARSSYFGIIDLAGFKKDRFYLYQAAWRPDLPMAHILPHWNWPERVGEVTPVHVFTSGDEAELFLNGESLGRKTKAQYDYRLRWDDVVYQPGELKVVAYKNGQQWATDSIKTTGAASAIKLSADRAGINADGKDLTFITAKVTDSNGLTVPTAKQLIRYSLDGPGEIVATDNGDPRSMVSFKSHNRKVFNGLGLVIVKAKRDQQGRIRLTATAEGLQSSSIDIVIQ